MIPRSTRRLSLTATVLLALAALACAGAPSASGASYVVQTCGAAANHAWSQTNSAPASLTMSSACGGLGPYGGLSIRGTTGGPNMADGASGQWTFTAPAGLSVSAITYSRWLWKQDDDDLQPQLRTAEGTALEGCSIVYPNWRCDIGASGGTPISITGLATTGLVLRVGCHLTSGYGCVADNETAAILYHSVVTVTDNAPPTANGTPTGTLLALGWQRGTRSVAWGGADASGIQDVIATIDGQNANHSAQSCDYSYPRPCSDITSTPVNVDTTTLTDGPHTLRVALRDAAGNETLSDPTTILVDNTAPGAPAVTAAPPEWTADPSPTIRLDLPTGQASPISEVRWTVCDSHGTTCGPQQARNDISSRQFAFNPEVPEGRHVVKAWLVDAAGNTNPTTAASISVNLDTTPPQAPTGLAVHGISDPHIYAVWNPPGDDGSPIMTTQTRLCSEHGCAAPIASDANQPASLGDLPPGTYMLTAWHTDTAGNQQPEHASSVTFTVPALEGSPALPLRPKAPESGDPPTTTIDRDLPIPPVPIAARADPHLRVSLRVRSRRRLTATITARGPDRVSLRLDVRDRYGSRVRTTTKRVHLKHGRATSSFVLASTARRVLARASCPATTTWLADTTSTSTRLPPLVR